LKITEKQLDDPGACKWKAKNNNQEKVPKKKKRGAGDDASNMFSSLVTCPA